ncbi:TPA: hypothetical protein N0F65_000431 [Lagenidium giganteum]|uniref:Polynucleotide adenylyltransferase n=1 Tax=Lagenidium giganteum TaxID=4803 RepID=A0AAV2YM71_9STRA|nr:TPA: hypothetical protein N0F65_000431 [Lagenidium giganteum]
MYWPTGTDGLALSRLSHEINSFAQYTNDLVNSVRPAVDAAIVSMSECVQSIWPEASVVCFGSFANGLWLPSSDIDVVIMGIPNEDINSKTSSKFLLGIKEQPWIQSIDVVRSAKVPVAKLVLLDSDLRMDISIENVHTRLGIEASHVVRDYVDAIPTLYPMIIVLKQFLREKGLNIAFTGGLSSYCVALMAAFFIQREGQVEAPLSEVGQLLLNFLEYYSMVFDYRTMGISLKPEAFGEYMLAAHLTMTNGVPLMPKLVIDDPVYLDGQHNAAAGAFAIARVIAAFENAFYAVSFHRATKFTPTPLCQMLHWTGHSASLQSTPPS